MTNSGQDRGVVYGVMAVAMAAWALLFRQFYTGETGLFPDGYSYFHWTKFYFDSISTGSYPMWDPFVNWGFPAGFKIRFLGEFNPLLLIAFIPYKLGVPYPAAYFAYAVSYFFIGMIGFYLICRQLLPGRWWACFGFVLLLFSNLGIAIFFNYCEIVLLVPGIWFFYFWLRFHRQPGRGPFLGMIFSAMLILVSYMPFYFLTVFGIFVLAALLLYLQDLRRILAMYGDFLQRHPVLVAVGAVLLIMAALPGYITYVETSSPEFSYAHRQADSEDSAVTTGIGMVNAGSILGPLTVTGLFSGFRHIDNYLSYFFLTVMAYPILLIGLFQPLTRRLLVCFIVAAGLFFITLTDATPVLPFLYEHIFYFKLIRNIFYLFYLAVPFMVLYLLLQWQAWWVRAGERAGRAQIWVTVCCAGMLAGLCFSGEILWSQYFSVGAFWLIVMLRLRGHLAGREQWFWLALMAVAALHPADVYRHYLRNVKGKRPITYATQAQRPVFFYQRPQAGEAREFPAGVMPESSGLVAHKFAGTAAAAELLNRIPPDQLGLYTRHKLIAYDGAAVMDSGRPAWSVIGRRLSRIVPPAMVFDPDAQGGHIPGTAPLIFREGSARLTVTDFGVNHIRLRTDFSKRRFLVYNDSYHSGWRAAVNGRSVAVYRANMAFKGIWLDPGENTVLLRFGSRWRELFYFALTVVFAAVLVIVALWEREARRTAYG